MCVCGGGYGEIIKHGQNDIIVSFCFLQQNALNGESREASENEIQYIASTQWMEYN